MPQPVTSPKSLKTFNGIAASLVNVHGFSFDGYDENGLNGGSEIAIFTYRETRIVLTDSNFEPWVKMEIFDAAQLTSTTFFTRDIELREKDILAALTEAELNRSDSWL